MPLLKSLRRQRLMPLLIAVQVALACAILANVLFLLAQQTAPLLVRDGVVRGQLLLVDQLVARKRWTDPMVQSGTRALQAIPGVRGVAPTIGLPARSAMTFTVPLRSPAGVRVEPSGFAGDGLIQALGLQVVQGRDFNDDDYAQTPPLFGRRAPPSHDIPVILTQALAQALFPDGDALGGRVSDEDGSQHYQVIGIVAHLLRHQLDEVNDGRAEFSLLYPQRHFGAVPFLAYAVRTDPQQRDAVRAQVSQVLQRQFGADQAEGVPIQVDPYEEVRAEGFKSRRAAVWLLGTVCVVVVLITALGIASVTAYWVEQRTRQIGIRRALGATRAQVLRQFLLENAVVAGLGLLAGLPLALSTNRLLMRYYELPRLPLAWLALGAVLLVLLGQCAVLAPARRAAAIEPATATRSA